MATSVIFTNPGIFVATASGLLSSAANVTELSQLCTEVGISRQWDIKDDTVFGMTAHSQKAGLEKWEVNVNAVMSYTTASPNLVNLEKLLQTLADIGSTGQNFWVEVRPTNVCSTVSNRRFFGPAILDGYSPVDGKIGDVLMTKFKFLSAGNFNQASSS